jgi:tryptophanyl-tRNA synthetase
MSTTASSDTGLVRVLDPPKTIEKRIKSAVTDSGSEVRRGPGKPGVTNLIEILSVVRGTTPEAIEAEFDGQQYGAFKGAVAEAVIDYLAPVRERYEQIRPDEKALESTLREGAERARELASETMADVRRAMGVGPAA